MPMPESSKAKDIQNLTSSFIPCFGTEISNFNLIFVKKENSGHWTFLYQLEHPLFISDVISSLSAWQTSESWNVCFVYCTHVFMYLLFLWKLSNLFLIYDLITFPVANFITSIILSNIISDALASLFLVLLLLFISVHAMIYSILASWDEEHIPLR